MLTQEPEQILTVLRQIEVAGAMADVFEVVLVHGNTEDGLDCNAIVP